MFVFVISNGRFGSTLAHELLARHRDVSPGDITLLEASLANHLRAWGYGGGP